MERCRCKLGNRPQNESLRVGERHMSLRGGSCAVCTKLTRPSPPSAARMLLTSVLPNDLL